MSKLAAFLFMSLAIVWIGNANATDGGGKGRPHVCDNTDSVRLQRCQNWISTVKRPDTRSSCCGDGDAYIADNFEIVDAHDQECQSARAARNDDVGSDTPCFFAIVTADYPDIIGYDEFGNATTTPSPFHIGSRVLIPPGKMNHDAEDAGNTSGHGSFFWTIGTGVICYFAPPLT
jgi:hypothetical protein